MRLFLFVCFILCLGKDEEYDVAARARICPYVAELEAHTILDYDLFPVTRAHHLALPMSCPFHPHHDRFAHARRGRAVHRGQYRCAFCQKTFPKPEALASHLREHDDKISAKHDKCYSDFCRMLGCASTEEQVKRLTQYERMLEHHKCRDVLNSCFDKHTAEGRALRDQFTARFCSQFDDASHGAPASVSDSSEVLKYLGLALLLVVLVVFYVLLIIWRNETVTADDLKQDSWLKRLQKMSSSINKAKVKGY